MSFFYPLNLEKSLNISVVISFTCLGTVFFHDPKSFTYLFYFVLLISAYLCRRQPGLLFIVLAVLFTSLIEEIAWQVLIHYDSKLLLISIYSLLGFAIYYLSNINGNKYPVRILWMVMVSAELYWYFSDYKSPIIYPYLLMIFQYLLLQWLLFFRVMLMEKRKYQMSHIELDRKMTQVAQWSIILVITMICEYLIRHLTDKQPMLIYNIYSPIFHVIAVYTIYLIFDSSYKQWLPRKLEV